jgi:hypothetical protein
LVQQSRFDPVGIDVDLSAARQQMPREFDIHAALSVAGNDIMGNNRNPHNISRFPFPILVFKRGSFRTEPEQSLEGDYS